MIERIARAAPLTGAVVAAAPQDPTPFAAWLRRELRASRLSQRQLAQRAGISHSTISRLLNETRQPSYRTAYRVAVCLGVLTADVPPVENDDNLEVRGPSSLARVEHALRADPVLRGGDVRELMRAYLRLRRRRLLAPDAPSARLRSVPAEIDGADRRSTACAGGRR